MTYNVFTKLIVSFEPISNLLQLYNITNLPRSCSITSQFLFSFPLIQGSHVSNDARLIFIWLTMLFEVARCGDTTIVIRSCIIVPSLIGSHYHYINFNNIIIYFETYATSFINCFECKVIFVSKFVTNGFVCSV